jgi:hypothetical protein
MPTIAEFMDSTYFKEFDRNRRDYMYIIDADRNVRIMEYAELGVDGSTHGEILEDIRDAFLMYAKEVELTKEEYDDMIAELNGEESRLHAMKLYDKTCGTTLEKR